MALKSGHGSRLVAPCTLQHLLIIDDWMPIDTDGRSQLGRNAMPIGVDADC